MTQVASFTQFVAGLGVTLTPAQRVLALVAYDGLEPGALVVEERAIARVIFGDIEVVPPEARHVLVAVCGARGGKSYVLCALRLLHLALTAPLDSLAPGELAAALIVAPDLRLGRQTLRFIIGAAKRSKPIASLISAETADSFILRREGGRAVSVETLPATRGGSAVRGRSLVAAALDEAAFFRDSDFIVNDAEIFKALAPRIMPGGQLIVASTPWAETGLLHDLFVANHGRPSNALAAHAPTTTLRNDPRTRSMVERERERDPDNAAREFDAVFMTAGSGLLLDPAAIDACVDDALVLPARVPSSATVAAGADFGFRSDSSAIAITYRLANVVSLAALEELRPSRGAPLRPSAVVASFAALANRYRVPAVMADSHYIEAVREGLEGQKLKLHAAPEGQSGKVDVYLELRRLVNERRLRLPKHARLIMQLKSVVSKPTSGGGLQISSPRRPGSGGHGDLVSALTLAVWQSKTTANRKPPARGGMLLTFESNMNW